jgi:hypothetical protein
VNERERELQKLRKPQLVQMHVRNGGLMGVETYMKWTKQELINAVLEDEGINPWSS